jgi:phospholipase C
MNANGITYRLYHDDNGPIEGMVSQVSSIQGIDLADVYNLSSFASDVQSGSYPYQYTFIEPNYGDVINSSYENGSSQHPMDGVTGGEALILKVYETLRNSPLWESSLLIVTYDEHGGFYDHFAPGSAQPPNDGSDSSKYNEYGFTFAQYGVRVPAVIVSPLLGNYVDHTVYDHTSVLATLEWLFGLQPLTERDARANPIFGVATSAAPRTDCPTKLRPPAALPKRLALTQEVRAARELEPVPDRSSLMGFLGVLVKADAKLSGTPEGRAAAIAKLQSIKSRGEARAYLHEVMEKVRIEKARRAR